MGQIFTTGRDGSFFSLRRDGTVNIFSSAGRDGKYFSQGGTGRKFNFPWTGRDGIVYSLAERDGKYRLLPSSCKVGAVVREDFPALLIARREPALRRRCSYRP